MRSSGISGMISTLRPSRLASSASIFLHSAATSASTGVSEVINSQGTPMSPATETRHVDRFPDEDCRAPRPRRGSRRVAMENWSPGPATGSAAADGSTPGCGPWFDLGSGPQAKENTRS